MPTAASRDGGARLECPAHPFERLLNAVVPMGRVRRRTGLARRASGSAPHDAGAAGGRRSGRGADRIVALTAASSMPLVLHNPRDKDEIFALLFNSHRRVTLSSIPKPKLFRPPAALCHFKRLQRLHRIHRAHLDPKYATQTDALS